LVRTCPAGDTITISHLLSHRSGIPHEIVPDSEMVRPFRAAEVVERARRLPLDFRPGARESYSSGGFEVLARILEIAGGMSYDSLLARRILAPLGMAHTGHIDGRALVHGRAAAYLAGHDGVENAPPQDFSGLVGAGSVWSTARDLDRFVQAIVSGRLGPGPRASYLRSGKLDFNGRTGGFKAWALYDSATATSAIFLGNVASGAPDWLKSSVMRLVAGECVPPPVLPALRRDVGEAELRRWVGVYQIEHGPRLDLHLRDGALYSNDWAMIPTVDGGLFSPRDYGIVHGVPGADGRLTRIDWIQGSETYPAPRVER
jgi:CubicO group peptidase (beta-lactamase class C family)